MENLYSILDTKQNYYGSLLTFKNDQVAVRAFMEMLISNDPNSLLALYPTDYQLMCLGHFDKDKGLIDGCAPQLVITGYDCMCRACDEVQRRKKFQDALSGISGVGSDTTDDDITLPETSDLACELK